MDIVKLANSVIYTAIDHANVRDVQLSMRCPNVNINRMTTLHMRRPLHYALFLNQPECPAMIPAILAHSDVDPNLRALNDNNNHLMTAVDFADFAFAGAKDEQNRLSSARHLFLLLQRDDVDIHMINEVGAL